MPLEPELEAIFNQDPRFASVLAEYERNGTSNADPLKVDPDHKGVTDEALQAYLDRFYPPRNPEFRSGAGSTRPPTGGWEDGDPRSLDGNEAPSGRQEPTGVLGQPEQDPQRGDQSGASSEATGTAPAPAPSTGDGAPGTPDPREATSPDLPEQDPFRPDPSLDPRALAAWQDFDRQLRQDPRLQQILLHYSTTGRIPTELVEPQSARVFTPPEPPAGLDLDDPGVRLLWNQHVDALRARHEDTERFNTALSELNSKIDTSSQEFQGRIEAENQGLVDRAVSSFAREHGLDQAEAGRILEIAENLGVAAHYMSGRDPITRLPVRPDPMAAVTRALEVAYNQDPIAQERERQRWQAAEKARIQADQDRRRKLAGVGGGSGSQPRAVAEPQSKEDRLGAATEYLRGIMFGEPTGGQQ